jgi:hypothetical protein
LTLADDFASLFQEESARRRLAELQDAQRTDLPTFSLTTSSLRHLNKWFDRLEQISSDRIPLNPHGNYFSDPGSLGLVDTRTRRLTPAGTHYLSLKDSVYSDPARAEYELVKTLYFSDFDFPQEVLSFLSAKRETLLSLLSQFSPVPARALFTTNAGLLTIAELLSTFPGAIRLFSNLPEDTLIDFIELGQDGFEQLYLENEPLPGLRRLCRRIGSDYTRGQERRLNYLLSMALLSISNVLDARITALEVPSPFSNLLTEVDIYNLHVLYTTSINIWFDGTAFVASSSLHSVVAPAQPLMGSINLLPQQGVPGGSGQASPRDERRRTRRHARASHVQVSLDQRVSEHAEDFIEENILRDLQNLIRVGHRAGETLALPDGMVPGADFYSLDQAETPNAFIEVKAIASDPPAVVALTRAEYLRARECFRNGIPYRLILVNVASSNCWEVNNLAQQLTTISIEELLQFSIRVG